MATHKSQSGVLMKRRYLFGFAIALCGGSAGVWFGSLPASDAATMSNGSTVAAGGCQQPTFPPGTPAPTTVTGPFQPAPSSPALSVDQSNGADVTIAPVCQWVVTFDPPSGDPTVNFTQYANVQMTLGTQYGVDYTGQTDVKCDETVEVLNGFGGGGAQDTLNSSNCNNDSYAPGEGSVAGALVNGTVGPDETVASFHSTVTSFASGADIYYGYFNACSEDPLGSHTNYACNYFYGGPSL
jgi:hypothetical protein